VLYLIAAFGLLWAIRWILGRTAVALTVLSASPKGEEEEYNDDDEEEEEEEDHDDDDGDDRIRRRRRRRRHKRPAAPSAPGPTLWNPDLLEDTLRRFIQLTPAHDSGWNGSNDRHPHHNHQGDRYKTETVCRELLEHMLQMPLPKVRPAWLVNPTTKRRLELDMYNEANRIAFEYDGAQHDVFTPTWHVNEHHFEYRRLLDRLKTELCREHGVMLIRIPWTDVSARDVSLTARYLERLLASHRVPYRSITAAAAAAATSSSPA
jgi:hypothetical protein